MNQTQPSEPAGDELEGIIDNLQFRIQEARGEDWWVEQENAYADAKTKLRSYTRNETRRVLSRLVEQHITVLRLGDVLDVVPLSSVTKELEGLE